MVESLIRAVLGVAGFMAIIVVIANIDPFIDWTDRIAEKRRHIRELKHRIKVWENIAKRYNPVTEACAKGYAIARLVILHHELDTLKARRIKYEE